jgi:hypothetical protein
MSTVAFVASVLLAATGQTGDAMDTPGETRMDSFFVGEKASDWDDLKPYSGMEAVGAIVGPHRKKCYELNYEQLGINYGDNVDYQLRQEQVLLCPQTVDFLYSEFTPLKTRYVKGARPQLEEVVAKATVGCATQREAALALMRYCRDLYKEEWYGEDFKNYVYGGSEEELIEKGEILCECLGRLHVALCGIAGIPGRIVMHDIGGHICSEVYVDGHWAYLDPRCGIYFEKSDGDLASVWDLLQDSSIIRAQSDAVKKDCSPWWNWEERAWKCENMYFQPEELNGFQNYSLSEAARFNYAQKTQKQATDDGLYVINKDYCREIDAVFGLAEGGFRFVWGARPLRRIPLTYRQDGFSMFYYPKPPMTPESLKKTLVDPFRDSNTEVLVWGLGPGSNFCFDTKVGEVFGEGLTEEQWKMGRIGDRHVNENVMGLIRAGHDPLRLACERAHELGLRFFARLEMNHEFGPPREDCWEWIAFVGNLSKEHPEYRIPGSVMLDFKHKAVRDFKLAIFQEAIDAGVDGIAMDLAVYPPFFEDPKAGMPIMTQLVRDARALLDEAGAKHGRSLELMVRVPAWDADTIGLDWQTWMKEGLIDCIVPTHFRANERFDVNVDEFIALGNRTGIKVVPTIWQALGFADSDPQPEDDKTGNVRYDKPKTKGMFFAQALLFHRAGVDSVQFGMAEMEITKWPWLDDLADPEKVLFGDKHYMVDPKPHCPVRFTHSGEKTVTLRIGDDIAGARKTGYGVETDLLLYATRMRDGDSLAIYVNGQGPALVDGNAGATGPDGDPLDSGKIGKDIYDKEWWRKGERKVRVDPQWWKLGENEIRLVFSRDGTESPVPFSITWVDFLIDYQESK